MRFIFAVVFLALPFTYFAQDAKLREVRGSVLRSRDLPAVELKFGKEFKYIGGQKFVLYDVANAEQHFFVDADKDGRVKRMYWVQFEGFLPNNDKTYAYKGTRTVNIGGLDFIADTYARNIKLNPGRPDGDGARGRAFLESKGYKLAGDETISQRFLHFIGEKKRDELMVIYLEVMTPLELTAADFEKGGKAESRWPEIAEAHLARAQKGMRLRRLN